VRIEIEIGIIDRLRRCLPEWWWQEQAARGERAGWQRQDKDRAGWQRRE